MLSEVDPCVLQNPKIEMFSVTYDATSCHGSGFGTVLEKYSTEAGSSCHMLIWDDLRTLLIWLDGYAI